MISESELLKLPVGTIVHWRDEHPDPTRRACRPALLVEHYEGFMGARMAWLAIFEPDGGKRRLSYWQPTPSGWHSMGDCEEAVASEKAAEAAHVASE